MRIVGRKKNSQQLVEFLLVAPFMVIILGILTEYAYALNINLTMTQALKNVTSSSYCSGSVSGSDCFGIYSNIKPEDNKDTTDSNILTLVENGFIQYLKDNNVPADDQNNIDVGFAREGQTVVFMAAYTYIPAFTLPNVYFKILPDKFNFFTTVAVPIAFLGDNSSYTIKKLKSDVLDKIWGANSFSAEADFENYKRGIMKNSEGGQNELLFLVPHSELSTAIAEPSLAKPLEMVRWNGSSDNLAVDMASGMVSHWKWDTKTVIVSYAKDGTPITQEVPYIKTEPQGSISGYIGSYTQVAFVHDGQASDFIGMSWEGARKNTIALTDGPLSLGNYDNIKVSDYNMGVAMGDSTYTVDYFGSTKVVHTTSDNIGVLGISSTQIEYDNIFGTKVQHSD